MCQKKIMRKRSHESFNEEPPRKKLSRGDTVDSKIIAPGEVLTDILGKQWKIGKVIGHGGFGEIYLASDNLQGCVKNDAPYVVKIESHSNGPLFVEVNCFLRVAKSDMISEWTKQKKLDFLGIPHYIASGSHKTENEKLRFLVLPRYGEDLEKILSRHANKFNLKTVINICLQILDTLEYIHSKGFVHCDIKASNILHSVVKLKKESSENIREPTPKREFNLRDCHAVKRNIFSSKRLNLRSVKRVNYSEMDNDSNFDDYIENEFKKMKVCNDYEDSRISEEGKVFLMDYGLATKYRQSNGQHRQYCNDERKAHAGTLLFCSLDAHMGAQARRSDLECLGYNMIYWLTAKLPWEQHIENPEAIEKEKKKNFNDLDKFLTYCFGNDYPIFVYKYFSYIRKLSFEQMPDYNLCKNLLLSALEEYGYKIDDKLDFDNLEGWGKKQKAKKKSDICHKNSPFIPRQPLLSNSPIKKPELRDKKRRKKKLNWSKILASDPEKIIRSILTEDKKPRDRKMTDPSEMPLQNLNIYKMNPTYAMMDVYNKCRDKNGNYNIPLKNAKGDSFIYEKRDGFTYAMNMVYSKVRERKLNDLSSYYSQNSVKKTRAIKTHHRRNDFKKTQSLHSIVKEVKKTRPVRSLRCQGLRG